MDKHRAWISRLSQVDWEHRAREAEFAPATMAAICFISLRQLERVFAHRFQCTLREWVRNYRFKLAKDLLAQGHSSKAVAAELNFGSPAHFCHQFKKFYGVPPSDFWPAWKPQSKPARSDSSSGQAR
jgi:AraC-like DNA-binding protein